MNVYFLLYKLFNLLDSRRILFGFVLAFSVILILDGVVYLVFDWFTQGETALKFQISFSPIVWLSVFALVLGTLIIVISIASQGTPRLIDLYLNNWPSIAFMWFIAISCSQSVALVMFDDVYHRPSSELFNTFFLLPVAMLGSLPYIFFILNYSKVDQVIVVINRKLNSEINKMRILSKFGLGEKPLIIKTHQHLILQRINQLTDLFYYVKYNESKESIIKHLSGTLENYIHEKPHIQQSFFFVTDEVKKDISFANYTAFQFQKMEKRLSFFEEKVLRILGNCYNEFLQKKNYELASVCCARIVHFGELAMEEDNDILLSVVTIRLNTIFRFSIKNSVSNRSSRTINNFIFQAGKLNDAAVRLNKKQELLKLFEFLHIYGTELYIKSLKENKIRFSVSYLLGEGKRTLIKINEEGWEEEYQLKLLDILLKVDDPDHVDYNEMAEDKFYNDDYRIILLGLCLYYCSEKKFSLAMKIVDDLVADLGVLDTKEKLKIFERSFSKLEKVPMAFWEDTDRGTFNIFYSHEIDLIDPLLDLIEERLN